MLDVSVKCVCVFLSTYAQTHMYKWSVCVFWLGFTQLPRATRSSKFHFRPSDAIFPLFLGPDFWVDPNFSCAQRVYAKSQKTPQNNGKPHNFRKIGRSAHILGPTNRVTMEPENLETVAKLKVCFLDESVWCPGAAARDSGYLCVLWLRSANIEFFFHEYAPTRRNFGPKNNTVGAYLWKKIDVGQRNRK